MSKESNFLQPKLTFAELGIQLMFPELLENQTQMLLVFLFILRVDRISSMNTTTNLSKYSMNTLFIMLMK